MKTNKVIKLVAAALMAAMTCIATVIIAVPSPVGGFIHPGDGFVILSGIILGPFFGGLAAGLGSMLADLLLGFSGYALATFVIKCFSAIVAVCVYRVLHKSKRLKIIPVLFASILGGVLVTIGYYVFESTLLGLGFATALLNVPFNLIQNAFGIIISIILFSLLHKVPQIRSIMEDN